MELNNEIDYSAWHCYVLKTKDGVLFKHLKQDPTYGEFFHLSSIANFYHERILYYFGIWYMQRFNTYDYKLINELLYLWVYTTSVITRTKDFERLLPLFEDITTYIEGEENSEKAKELVNLYCDYMETWRKMKRDEVSR